MQAYEEDGKWKVRLTKGEKRTLDGARKVLKPLSEIESTSKTLAAVAAAAMANLNAELENPGQLQIVP